MRVSVFSFRALLGFLRRNRVGLAAVCALTVPGVAAGFTLAKRLLPNEIAAWAEAFASGNAVLETGMALFAGLLPALLFGATMLVCTFSTLCLPLWAAAVLLYWTVRGAALGILAGMCGAGAALAAHCTILPGALITLPPDLLLVLLPLRRMTTPPDPFGFDDVAGGVLSAVVPAAASAAFMTAATTFGCILVRRIAP